MRQTAMMAIDQTAAIHRSQRLRKVVGEIPHGGREEKSRIFLFLGLQKFIDFYSIGQKILPPFVFVSIVIKKGKYMYTQSDIETVKNIILDNIPNIRAIYLFGSYAQGTANEKSDLDIMTVTEQRFHWKQRKEIMNRLYDHLGNENLDVDIILKPEGEFLVDRELPTISRKIEREGIKLWNRS